MYDDDEAEALPSVPQIGKISLPALPAISLHLRAGGAEGGMKHPSLYIKNI
jgi:hypothetical protein